MCLKKLTGLQEVIKVLCLQCNHNSFTKLTISIEVFSRLCLSHKCEFKIFFIKVQFNDLENFDFLLKNVLYAS